MKGLGRTHSKGISSSVFPFVTHVPKAIHMDAEIFSIQLIN